MSGIRVIKTEYERCEPVGRELLRKAKDAQAYRKNWADKEVGQAAKEAATHLAGIARGRVSITIDSSDYDRIFGKKRRSNAA